MVCRAHVEAYKREPDQSHAMPLEFSVIQPSLSHSLLTFPSYFCLLYRIAAVSPKVLGLVLIQNYR